MAWTTAVKAEPTATPMARSSALARRAKARNSLNDDAKRSTTHGLSLLALVQLHLTRTGAGGGIRTHDLTITNRLRYHCATPARNIPRLVTDRARL